ncbi:glycosyltransferase family 4 protein [Spirulina sp. 06S082]|uniref:glycosyltransferase family 4 protein n=1 Tax=Spirulina sp. 06S082 TaxID=3110248 RepID=UPI002B205A82|nr:glycosyltransferase family 4 protein [Spirulina sp. 06S082]MEA5467371.1 glycosyltransferase family 4 protein [Spirulina sp. 06S082]
MNILQINQSDISGGAGIAAYRLHQKLLDRGIDAKMLVGEAKTNSDRIAKISRNQWLENQLSRFNRRLSLNYLNILSSFAIPKHSWFQEADIINFHNLHTGYFNYLAIPQLTQAKPSVYTLHDMWSFTGHCAYSYDCDRWKIGCGKCPYPNEYPEIQRDSTPWEWKLKNWVYSHSHLTIVTPSQWLKSLVKKSMLKNFPVHHIPNGIDLDIYQPLDRQQCCDLLGLNSDKFILLFGVENLTYRRKGGDLLLKALSYLSTSLQKKIILLSFGNGGEKIAETLGIESISLGYVFHDRFKAIAYSAANAFILPTRADNLPLTIQESLACGTPIISFNIGGVPELVRPEITGYLAKPEDARDLSRGIVKLLENETLRSRLSENCRKIAIKEYSLSLQVERYIELYQQIIQTS